MTATYRIEAIDDDLRQRCRGADAALIGADFPRHWVPWVARLTAYHPWYGYEREFLRGQKDYSDANSVGSRRVWYYYTLRQGEVYEANQQLSRRKRGVRVFLTVLDGKAVEITEEEVRECLSAASE